MWPMWPAVAGGGHCPIKYACFVWCMVHWISIWSALLLWWFELHWAARREINHQRESTASKRKCAVCHCCHGREKATGKLVWHFAPCILHCYFYCWHSVNTQKCIFGEMQDVSNLVIKNLHATDVRTSNPWTWHLLRPYIWCHWDSGDNSRRVFNSIQHPSRCIH